MLVWTRRRAYRSRGTLVRVHRRSAQLITGATNAIRGYRSVTTLTIRATPTLSNKWLLPRLEQFLAANPDFDVRLDGTNEPTDFN